MKVKVVGDPFSISGYSLVCRELLIALIEAGVDVSLSIKVMDKERYQGFPKAAMIKDIVDKDNGAQVSLQVCNPGLFNQFVCEKNIGLFFYEASELPKHFTDGCNKMDAIIAPSEFVARVCEKSGVTVPVFVAHGYIESIPFEKYDWKKQLEIPEDHKMLLSCFQWSYRKGWDVLLRSYWGAFSNTDKVTLVLKVYGADTSQESQKHIMEDIQKLKSMFAIVTPNGKQGLPDLPEVRLILSKLSDEGMQSLYDACDAFVLPTRGEGWGRPVLEAMAHGKPIVATNWGSLSEFLTKENSYPLPCEIEPCMACNGYTYPITSFFAAPSVFWLSKFMSYLVLADKDVNDKFSPENASEGAFRFTKERCVEEHLRAIESVVG